jgi:putative ABC transport system permease protein
MTHRPIGLRVSLGLIRVAAKVVPRSRRRLWVRQWEAEVLHRWHRRHDIEMPPTHLSRGMVLWSVGAFAHAWYLFRTEYTMDLIWQDVKFGIRALRRGKGLISVAVLSLAIGIGANTSIFSAVDVFMLRPLPYPDSDRLYTIWTTNLERGWSHVSFSVPDFLDLRERSDDLSVAATQYAGFNLSDGDIPERVAGKLVTWDFFRVLEVQPALGRGFTRDEERAGQDRVVVISHGLWERRFGANPSVLGASLLVDGVSRTVVGVTPPNFWFLEPGTDIWAPMGFTGEENRGSHYIRVLARLNDGVTLEQARQEAELITDQLAQEYPESNSGKGVRFITLHEDVFDEGFQMGSLIASVGVAFLLLIACANVANLLLTHAAGRDREVALRGALGAGRSRLLRQFLTESTLVAAMGGILGLALSIVGIRALLSVAPSNFPRMEEIGLSPRVLMFTACISILTGFIFGLAPALQGSKSDVIGVLKEGARGGTAAKAMRLRKILVVAEVSLALVLLVSSALLVQGFWRLRIADLGFDPADVLTFQTALPATEYPDVEATVAFLTEFENRLRSLPGVSAVSANSILPSKSNSSTFYTLPGEEAETDLQRKVAGYRYVLPGYFDAMDIPLTRGRDFAVTDRPGTPRAAIINETMARLHWADGDPVGQELVFASGPRVIVGLVDDSRDGPLDDAIRPKVYFSATQSELRSVGWVVETSVPPESMTEAVRSELRAINPNLPLYEARTMDGLLDYMLAGDLLMAKIMAAVALLALVLSLGGVYGVTAHSVSQRTQELGIRMALGAQRADVLRMVVRQGAIMALIGLAIGVAIALGVTRGLAQFLYGVSPFDPLTFGAVALVLFGAGLAATFFPARRATRIDPIVALRAE